MPAVRRPTQARAKEKVRAILDAAETLLPDLVMRDVARAAGVKPATLYDWFPTKELLLEALEERRWERASARARSAVHAALNGAQLADELEALVRNAPRVAIPSVPRHDEPLRVAVATETIAVLACIGARDHSGEMSEWVREVTRLIAGYLS